MPATPLTARGTIHRKVSASVEVTESQKWLSDLLKDAVSSFFFYKKTTTCCKHVSSNLRNLSTVQNIEGRVKSTLCNFRRIKL